MIKAIKRFFGFYRNRRRNTRCYREIPGLPDYIRYFTNTPQHVINQHRK